MKLIVKDHKFHIKFGFKALAKSGVLEDVAKMQELFGNDDNADDIDMLKKMPEIFDTIAKLLLAGLQKYNEEYKVDYDDPDSLKDGMDKAYDFLDAYQDEDDAMDFMELFSKLTEELMNNGFLSRKSPKLEKAMEEQDATIVPLDHIQSLD